MASGWTLAEVRQSGRDPAEMELAKKAVKISETLDLRLDTMTGYRQTGDLRLARTEDETDVILNLVHSQAAKGLQIELLDIRQAQQIAPALSNEFLLATGVQTNLLLEGLGVYIPMTTPLVFAFQTVPLTNF